MKKLLLASAAICGLSMASAPAYAQIDLDLGGYVKAYGAYVDQDETGTNEARNFDMLRNSEIHLQGETTLDNGLTVGVHLETEADADDAFEVEESYVYMSGTWGRVNIGAEDGAAFLLQVAAPSADSNVDGIRQLIQPVNYSITTASDLAGADIEYDQNQTGYADKVTYLSPVMSGFQLGASYTPDVQDNSGFGQASGVRQDDQSGEYGSAYDIAVRYEGEFEGIGLALGAGYTYVDLEQTPTVAITDTSSVHTDDRQAWNIGADLNIGAFGLGFVYTEDTYGDDTRISGTTLVTGVAAAPVKSEEEKIYVIGADYTNGPFKLGASYLNSDNTLGNSLDTERYTGGVVYTYGPGMTFRGSIQYVDHDVRGATADTDATSVLLGTQINF
jgi:outer membrane protein OmpU